MLSPVFGIYCLARNGNLISHSSAFSIIIGMAAHLNVCSVGCRSSRRYGPYRICMEHRRMAHINMYLLQWNSWVYRITSEHIAQYRRPACFLNHSNKSFRIILHTWSEDMCWLQCVHITRSYKLRLPTRPSSNFSSIYCHPYRYCFHNTYKQIHLQVDADTARCRRLQWNNNARVRCSTEMARIVDVFARHTDGRWLQLSRIDNSRIGNSSENWRFT